MPSPFETTITTHELLHYIFKNNKPITIKEIANKYDLNYNTVRNLISRTRKKGHLRYVGKIGGRNLYSLTDLGISRLIWYSQHGCKNPDCKIKNDMRFYTYNIRTKTLTMIS